MKKNRFRHLVALILLMCCTLGYAQTFKFQGLTYKVINTSKRYVEVVDVADKANTKTVKIPTILTRGGVTYTVTNIGRMAFSGCKSLRSITIPSSVISIGTWAFNSCSSLTSITMPYGVKSVGGGAFWGCKSLRSITIPSSVTSIGNLAFRACKSLTSITIPTHITNIDKLGVPEETRIIRENV